MLRLYKICTMTVQTFKYLGSLFDANGGAEKDVNNTVNRIQTGQNGGKLGPTGVMCDRNIPTKLKDNVYNTAIKPAIVYGALLPTFTYTRTQRNQHDHQDTYHKGGIHPNSTLPE